jgi:hemerythrin-like metal-binding protein
MDAGDRCDFEAQHRALHRLLAELQQAVNAEDRDATTRALEAVWSDVVSHFAMEDSAMEEFAYPERNPHRTAHHLFISDMKALLAKLHEQGLTEEVTTWAAERMPDWFRWHIETNDVPLERFLARRAAARLLAGAQGEPPTKPVRDA